jgi:L-ascorbate metabolism protein UlaG (beta-lactamase superfamily)
MARPLLLRMLTAFVLVAGPAFAQGASDSEPCLGLVSSRDPLIRPAALAPNEVGLTYVGHATFLIESPGGVRAATDYNDYVRPSVTPDIATMNKAHSTHYSSHPDTGIKHVLRGWNPEGGPAKHDLTVGDMHVWNVPTNIRDWSGGTERDANSIFVFETAGLCIAHLGHLHHELLPGHLRRLGRIDVVLVPVDGSWTMDLDGMMDVLKRLNARLMIPMHYFGQATLNRFLDRARREWPVELSNANSVTVSRESLPETPKVLVLPGH